MYKLHYSVHRQNNKKKRKEKELGESLLKSVNVKPTERSVCQSNIVHIHVNVAVQCFTVKVQSTTTSCHEDKRTRVKYRLSE